MSQARAILYIRDLPGGGYVCIEGEPDPHGTRYRGALRVERRSEADRRDGHPPPVVLETAGLTQGEVFRRLVTVADSNVEVAAAMLRWQARHGGGTASSGGDLAPIPP